MDKNLPDLLSSLVGYLTLPGMALAVAGAVVGWRRDRVLTAMLVVWFVAPIVSTVALPYSVYPRYFTTSIPPFAALVAIAAVAGAAALRARLQARGDTFARCAVGAVVLLAALPALAFGVRVLAHPATTRYPGLDDLQYAKSWSSVEPAHIVAPAIRERSAAGAVVTIATVGTLPAPFDLLLNPGRPGPGARFVFVVGDLSATVPPQTQFAVVDHDYPVPRGFRRVLSVGRPRSGDAMTLYERGG